MDAEGGVAGAAPAQPAALADEQPGRPGRLVAGLVALAGFACTALGAAAATEAWLVVEWVATRLWSGRGLLVAGMAPWLLGGPLLAGAGLWLMVAGARRRWPPRRAVAVLAGGAAVLAMPCAFWYGCVFVNAPPEQWARWLRDPIEPAIPFALLVAAGTALLLWRRRWPASEGGRGHAWSVRIAVWGGVGALAVPWAVERWLDRLPPAGVLPPGRGPRPDLVATIDAARRDLWWHHGPGGRFATNWVGDVSRLAPIATLMSGCALAGPSYGPGAGTFFPYPSAAAPLLVPTLARLLPERIGFVQGSPEARSWVLDLLRYLNDWSVAATEATLAELDAPGSDQAALLTTLVAIARRAPEPLRRRCIERARAIAAAAPGSYAAVKAWHVQLRLDSDSVSRVASATALTDVALDDDSPWHASAAEALAEDGAGVAPAVARIERALLECMRAKQPAGGGQPLASWPLFPRTWPGSLWAVVASPAAPAEIRERCVAEALASSNEALHHCACRVIVLSGHQCSGARPCVPT